MLTVLLAVEKTYSCLDHNRSKFPHKAAVVADGSMSLLPDSTVLHRRGVQTACSLHQQLQPMKNVKPGKRHFTSEPRRLLLGNQFGPLPGRV